MKLIRRRFWIPLALIVAGGTAVAVYDIVLRCTAIKSWDSPRMARLEAKWDAIYEKWESGHSGKTEHYEMRKSHVALLEWNISLYSAQNLADTIDMIPSDSGDRSDFENGVLEIVLWRLADSDDHERLSRVMSDRVPNFNWGYPVMY